MGENTPLMVAARDGDEKSALALIKKIDVKIKNESGLAALSLAALNGHKNIVQALLDNGAPINETDMYNHTPVSHAAIVGHVDVVRLLIGRNADLTIKSKAGDTALDLARRHGHKEVEQLLKNALQKPTRFKQPKL